MATPEILGPSPEQQQTYRQIAGFFGRAEREFPAAAKQLVNVVGGLVGEQRTTQNELQAGMGKIDVGLALIGDWLREVGGDGFEVNLGFGGGAKKAFGRSQVKFPSVSDLIRVDGRIDRELQRQISPLLSSFSRQIEGALDVGLTPRQIVGGLVVESVGSELSANGSANLRETLNKPLGGHFEWIREALGIADVAAQAGFTPKEPAAKEEQKTERVPIEIGVKILSNPDHPLYTEDKAVGLVLLGGRSGLIAAIDGVGSGGSMSAKAAEIVQGKLQDLGKSLNSPPTIGQAVEMLCRQILAGAGEIRTLQKNQRNSDIDTTVSAGLICESPDGKKRFLVTVNVGDSRVYRFSPKRGTFDQLTMDHSLVQSLTVSGMISADEAFFHQDRNVVYRTVGSLKMADQVDAAVTEVEDGDIFLAVSDGLSDNIPPKILPLAFQDEFRKAFDPASGGPDLKKLASGLAQRARNIQVEGRAKQAKPDDICVAILRVPKEKAALEKPEEVLRRAREDAGRRVEVSPQQRFSTLITQVQEQLKVATLDRGTMRDNLLELFDVATEITAADPSGEQRLVRSLTVLLKVAKEKEVIFSAKTKGKTAAERRDMVVALVAEAKALVSQSYALLPGQRERMGEVMRQLLDHTVALGSGDKMGVSLARLLRVARGKQVKLGGEKT